MTAAAPDDDPAARLNVIVAVDMAIVVALVIAVVVVAVVPDSVAVADFVAAPQVTLAAVDADKDDDNAADVALSHGHYSPCPFAPLLSD